MKFPTFYLQEQIMGNICFHVGNYYWLGVTDEGHEGVWTWISDGTTAGTYIRKIGGYLFRNGSPDNSQTGGEQCAEVYSGAINDQLCTFTTRGLCQRPGINFIIIRFKYCYN